jgi:hypothetical protein
MANVPVRCIRPPLQNHLNFEFFNQTFHPGTLSRALAAFNR